LEKDTDKKMTMDLTINIVGQLKGVPIKNWWNKNDDLKNILDCIKNSQLIMFNQLDLTEKKYEINTVENVLDFIPQINVYSNSILFNINEIEDNSHNKSVQFSLSPEDFSISIFFDNGNQKVYQKMINLLWDILSTLENRWVFAPLSNILTTMKFPRIKPVRSNNTLTSGSLINMMQEDAFLHLPQLESEGIHKLISDKLPQDVQRETKGKFAMIKWCSSISNEKEVEKALVKREKWIYENIKLDLESNFNKYGDKNLFNVSSLNKITEENNYFTYYNPKFKIAYKLYVLDEKNGIDIDNQKIINSYHKKGKLKNGLPINKIILVTTNRKNALLIEGQAKTLGVYKVFYIDTNLNLWDMHPKGSWIN